VVGDGGLSMSLAELATAARYRLPIRVVVLNNGVLAQIKWEQMLFLGNPEFACDLAPIDFARAAEAMGIKGLRTDDPERIAGLLDEAIRPRRPRADRTQSRIPTSRCCLPKRREEYMKHLSKAFEIGTPGQAEIEQRLKEEPASTRAQALSNTCTVLWMEI